MHAFLKYITWTVFTCFLFLTSDLLRWLPLSERYHVPVLEVAGNYAVIFMYALPPLGVLSALLAAAQALAAVLRSVRALPQGFVFALFLASWLNLLRLLLAASGLRLLSLRDKHQILGFFLAGLAIFALFRLPLSMWVDATAKRLRPVVAGALAVCGALVALLWANDVQPGRLSRVMRAGQAGPPPTVIVLILDSLTRYDMSLYGHELPTTPNLDALAGSWTVYLDAHSTGNNTLPALPSILTGRYPYLKEWHRYGDIAGRSEGWLSLPGVLKSFGYETVYLQGGGHPPSLYHFHRDFDQVVRLVRGHHLARDILYAMPGMSIEAWTALWPRFMQILEYVVPAFPLPGSPELVEPMYQFAEVYLQRRVASGASRPLFLYMHMLRPHAPYVANEYAGRLAAGRAAALRPGRANGAWPEERLRFNENVLKADAQVARLLAAVRRLGLYEDSLIIITADHGVSFDEPTPRTATMPAAEHAIPLLVKYPRQREGRRVAGVVSLVDILPTVLEAAGASYPAVWVDGESLTRAGSTLGRTVYVQRTNGAPEALAAISRKHKLVRHKGAESLFDLYADPYERQELPGTQDAAVLREALERYTRRLRAIRAGTDVLSAPPLGAGARQPGDTAARGPAWR